MPNERIPLKFYFYCRAAGRARSRSASVRPSQRLAVHKRGWRGLTASSASAALFERANALYAKGFERVAVPGIVVRSEAGTPERASRGGTPCQRRRPPPPPAGVPEAPP